MKEERVNNANFSAACRGDKDCQGGEAGLSPLGEPVVHTMGKVEKLIKKKKILFITTGLGGGGAEMVLRRLIHGIKNEFQMEVISLIDKGVVASKIRDDGVMVHELSFRNLWQIFSHLRRFYAIVSNFKPDIIQGWMYLGNLFAYVARLLWVRKSKLFFGVRQSLGHIFVNKIMTLFIIFLGGIFSRAADKVIYNSYAGKRDHEKYGYAKKNGMVIYNGFDTDVFSPVAANHDLLCDELQIDRSSFLIGIIGRFHPVKDYDTFIHAAGILSAADNNTHFVMVGLGVDNQNKYLMDIINVYPQLKGRIHLLGQRDDIPYLSSSFDVFTNCSLSEGTSNCLCEALASGVVCVATDVGDSKRIVDDVGFVVSAQAPEQLVAAWRKIMAMSKEKRNEYAIASRQKIVQQYSIASMISHYREVYKESIGSRVGVVKRISTIIGLFKESNPIFAGAGIVAIGSVIGYLALFLFSPWLSILYTPQQFGYYSVCFSLITIISTVASGKYESAIVVGKTQEEVNLLAKISIITVFMVSGFCLVIALLKDVLLSLFHLNINNVSQYLFYIIIGIFVMGIYQVLYNIALRNKSYKKIAICEIQLKCGQVMFQIIFGVFAQMAFGLILGFILSLVLAMVVIIKPILTREFLSYKEYKLELLLKTGKQYFHFPRFIAPGYLINVLTWQLPIIFIGGIYNAHEAGIYALLLRFFGVPVYLVGQLINNVYFSHVAAELRNTSNKQHPLFVNTLTKMSALIPVFILIALFGPKIFLLIFAKSWSGAAAYIPILSLMHLFKVLAIPFGSMLIGLNRYKWYFFREFILFFLTIIVFVVGWWAKFNVLTLLFYYSIVSSIYYIIYILVSWRAIKKHDTSILYE